MFVAAYWWRVHAGKEEQFRAAWRRGTELIQQKYGSLGSRLHRDKDGRFVGVAEWPDEATWQAAFDQKMVYDDPGNAGHLRRRHRRGRGRTAAADGSH